jgi:two-component system, chemotaxis family, sensor kinase CheA
MMMIEDEEFREVYRTATTERLHKMESGLLYLEKNPDDRAKLEDFLREAHTLKGDSRMLGVTEVETLTHQIEECLAEVKRGEGSISSHLCDRLYKGLDAISKLVQEAVTGEEADVDVFSVLAELMGADTETELKSESAIEQLSFEDSNWMEAIAQMETEGQRGGGDSVPSLKAETEKKISQSSVSNSPETAIAGDTIRVDAEKLDFLMRQAGELSVTKSRVARRLSEIQEILNLWEEWNRDSSMNRVVFRQLEQQLDENFSEHIRNFQQGNEHKLERLGDLVDRLKNELYEDTASLDTIAYEIESSINTLRLLPFANVFNLFPRMVRDLAKQQGKEINLIIEGADTKVDKRILEEMKDPLLHLLRNAVDHGIETATDREKSGKPRQATIRLRGYQTGNSIGIDIVDDGRGLNLDSIKQTALRRGVCTEEELANMSSVEIQSLIFAPGFSTRTEITEISGRGIGLDIVRANVERLKGTIHVESVFGMGCEFRLRLSASLATTQVLITEVDRTPYAIPIDDVETMLLVSRSEIYVVEGSQTITFADEPVSVVWLADLLELEVDAPSSVKNSSLDAKTIPCIIFKIGSERLGIFVDALLDRQDIVLKPQSKLIKRIRNISGATILGNGEVCMVLNPQDLLKSIHKGSGNFARSIEERISKNKILLVEDSIIIRTQMKRLLEGAGFNVTIAVDGLEGFNKLKGGGKFDAVVSDVEMPNLSGLELTARIRQYQEYNELPIVLVTTLASQSDRRRGAEAGANAYLTKGDFDQKLLLDTLRRLI